MDKIRPEDQPDYVFRPGEYESPGMQRTQRELTERAIELLGITSGKVLDVGCGTGLSSLVLKEHGFEVVGIDSSKAMADKARERGIDAYLADMHDVPLNTSYFDAIVSISTIQWSRRPKELAREFARLLKPNGRVVAQFYPGSEKAAIEVCKGFASTGFIGGLQVDNPKSPKRKRFFLVMRKQ
jgi:ubiquinone/menaquinone biosynthesis C-methylase UbiE